MLIIIYIQAILPLGTIALAVGSYMAFAGRRRRRSEQAVEEEFMDRAAAVVERSIFNFTRKFNL